MVGFNMNGKSSDARLDFIRKETGKVKSQVQRTDMYRQLRPIQLEACFGTCESVGRTLCVKVIHSLVIVETPNLKKEKITRHNMRKLEDERSLSLVFCLKGPLIKTFPSPSYIG